MESKDTGYQRYFWMVGLALAALQLIKSWGSLILGWEGSIGVEFSMMRLIVMLQMVEIGLVKYGVVKGNIRHLVWVTAGNLILVFRFLSVSSDRMLLLSYCLIWAGMETVRFSNLLFPDLYYLSLKRNLYPLFLGLIAPYLCLCLMNDYIKINAEEISYEMINFIRLLQLAQIILAAVVYKRYVKEFRSKLQQDKSEKIRNE